MKHFLSFVFLLYYSEALKYPLYTFQECKVEEKKIEYIDHRSGFYLIEFDSKPQVRWGVWKVMILF